MCFVCVEQPQGHIRPMGTAFFVAIPRVTGIGGSWIYLVTARHVLSGIKRLRPDGAFLLRMNSADGKAVFVSTDCDQWKTHPDDTVVDDTAVLAWAPSPEVIDFRVFPIGQEDINKAFAELDIGPGDEVFLPGLFVHRVGKESNVPIIRIGNIAAMPGEPVETKIGPMEAYLIEARSIGGLSGSPVFVNAGTSRVIGNTIKMGGPSFHLLGIMHGHYKVDIAKLEDDAEGVGEEAINMGIAIVVPATRILEIINMPDWKNMRDKMDQEAQQATMPVLDISEVTEDATSDLMGKLLKVPKEEADEVHQSHDQ